MSTRHQGTVVGVESTHHGSDLQVEGRARSGRTVTDQGVGNQAVAVELPQRNEHGTAGQTVLLEVGEPRHHCSIQSRLLGRTHEVDYDYRQPAGFQESDLT